MSDDSISKTLSLSGGSAKITAQHNKKFQCAVLYVEFTTSQKDLLCLLLQKYVEEKRLATGLNMNNSIYSAIVGETSIALFVPENKLTNNIALLLSYLHKTHLTSMQNRLIHNGDYGKLSQDIKSFEVIITGKCKTFIAALKSNATKINNLISQLNAIEPKSRDSFNNTNVIESSYGEVVNFDGNSADAKLYASIILEDIPAKITNSGITLLCENGIARLSEKMRFKDVYQGKVKSFLTQTGAVGSPAANDKDGSKFKAKSEYILKCEDCLAKIYSGLRGFSYSFRNVEALKKVESSAISKVKSISC